MCIRTTGLLVMKAVEAIIIPEEYAAVDILTYIENRILQQDLVHIHTGKEAIQVIETKKLDKSQFDFPFGSYDKFKKRVLAGELEMKPLNMMTQEEQE